jgi:hypothetical protein
MTDEVSLFRYEYISGAVDIFHTDGAFFFINVTNRGSTDGVARAFVINADGGTVFDSEQLGDMTVMPGRTSSIGMQVDDPRLTPHDNFHARIFTSSSNLVPSARAYSIGDPNDEDTPPVTDVYFAPSDFARFVLPVIINFPRPPIGGVET